jgi:branched-chain amino acid transport system substrate-binding protein
MKIRACTAAVAALALAASVPPAEQQGVSKTEIVLGSIQDLSGPLAGFGKQVRMGMQLRVDEANEQGGVNGRKLKLLSRTRATTRRRRCWRRRSSSTRTRSS